MQTLRTDGPRGVLRRYGWKVVAAVFGYYLVRDLTLYVLVPYLLFKGCIA